MGRDIAVTTALVTVAILGLVIAVLLFVRWVTGEPGKSLFGFPSVAQLGGAVVLMLVLLAAAYVGVTLGAWRIG